MAVAAIDLWACFPRFPEISPASGREAFDVDGTGFSNLFGAETGFECGGLCLCLGEEGVASLRIVSGSS